MYCPRCEIEYDTKSNNCPDCYSQLVTNLLGQSSAVTPDNSWVVIAGVNDEINKELARGAIESGNIPSLFINTEDKIDTALIASLINSNSQIELEKNIIMVPNEYRLDALLLLKGLFGVEIEFEMKNNSGYN